MSETEPKRREPIKVEKEEAPWRKLEVEEGSNLISRYEKKSELSKEHKKDIARILGQETDQIKIDFAKDWFKEHKDEIKDKGFDIENEEEGYRLRIASQLGAFKELNTNAEHREKREEIDNLYALRTDLEKDAVPLESQFLILNRLNKRTERLKEEVKEAKEKRDKATAKSKESELKELFEVGKELAEKISGRDLKNEAVNEAKKTKLLIKEKDVNLAIEEKINSIGKSPEKAVAGIEGVYGKVKERLITEFTEKGLKKEEKNKKALEGIKEKFKGQGKNQTELIDKIVHRKERLGGLTDKWDEKDEGIISDFLAGEGISVSSENLTTFKKLADEINPYEKAVGQQKGFVDWLLNVILLALSKQEEGEKVK